MKELTDWPFDKMKKPIKDLSDNELTELLEFADAEIREWEEFRKTVEFEKAVRGRNAKDRMTLTKLLEEYERETKD